MDSKLKFYNTLTRSLEVFKPLKKEVTMYSCGPTIYNYAHIGNLRTYIFNDLLKRTILYNKLKVKHAMNLTDVDDKTISASQKEGIPLKELTTRYEKAFLEDLDSLNILKPSIILKATLTIKEMVSMIKSLLEKGYAYKTEEGIYFSISKSKNYGKLANLEKIKNTKSRITKDEYDKTNQGDFALWKFWTKEDGNVFWETEIGKGRPGWHIECSAMSIKALGEQIDIHTGAQDLIFPHHTNEIAQSEAFTKKKFVNYWIHPAFLNMKEDKMSKSLGNILTLRDLTEKEYEPIYFRYLCLQTHYRKPLYFSEENLEAAKSAFERIKKKILELKKLQIKSKDLTSVYAPEFKEAINDDLNIPLALQVFIKTLEDKNFTTTKKIKLLEKFDSVLGLGIKDFKEIDFKIPKEVQELARDREEFRKNKNWPEADILRQRIKDLGFQVIDIQEGYKIEKL